MRKVLISAVILVVLLVVIIAGMALRPVSAPADALPTTTVIESCGVIDVIGTPMSSQELAVQNAVQNQLDGLMPTMALVLNDTGLSVTPAVSKCVPLEN